MLPQRELSRAVLIGTSDFQQLPLLPAVSNNLVDLRAALTDDEVGILGWEQCAVVDSPDSPTSMISRLRAAATQAQDLLLVYYAGHGIRVGDEEELYLTVRQSNGDSPLDTCVPFEWVRRAVVDSPARTKLLILDCCYSGMALGTMSAPVVDTRQIEITGTTVITSSPRNSVSHSLPGERHTAFTGELITLLRAGSPLPAQPLTVDELFRSLLAAMARRELPHPKKRSDDTSGALQLRRLNAPEPVALPEPEPVVVVPEPVVAWPPPEPVRRVEEPDTIRFKPVKPPVNLAPIGAVARVYLPFIGTIVCVGFADFALALFVGAAFGTRTSTATGASDLEMAIVMTVLAAVFGGPGLLWHIKGGRRLVLEDAAPVVAKWTAPIRVILVVLALFVCALTASVGLFVSTPPPSQPSSYTTLSSTLSLLLATIEGGAACVYTLVRRIRRTSRPPLLSSPRLPVPPMHS